MRVVFLCGGSGTRLWPESRESLPKQFIPIFNNKSLLDLTIERALHLIKKTKPIFICNKKHGFLVKNKSIKSLANAMIKMLKQDYKSTLLMGERSYLLAKESFDVNLVTENIIKIIKG